MVKQKNIKIKWEKVVLKIIHNIRTDVTGFLSYIFSVTIQMALLYYIMKILGEFMIFIFEKNGITGSARLDIIPTILWAFGLIYIMKTSYKKS